MKNFQFSIFNFQNLIPVFAYLFIGLFVYTFIASSVGAACAPIYGGGPTCTESSLVVEKAVLNPKTNLFVHNLGLSDRKYQANELVDFQITLTNNGSTALQKIIVKDSFPRVLAFHDGPGQYDARANILTFVVNNLPAGHTQLFTLSGRVVSQNQFPNQKTFCTSNEVSALPSSGSIVQDSSQFCVEKLTTSPATGPEMWSLLSLVPTAFIGWKIKRATR